MISTALTSRELEALAGLAAGQKVYEAGALLGASTLALARHAAHVVSVDPHDGYPEHAPRPTWQEYLHNVGGRRNVVPVRAGFEAVPIPQGTTFAWADLTGAYALTLQFLHHAAKGPVVAVHDYERAGCEGATRAVDEVVRQGRYRVERYDTLIVLRR